MYVGHNLSRPPWTTLQRQRPEVGSTTLLPRKLKCIRYQVKRKSDGLVRREHEKDRMCEEKNLYFKGNDRYKGKRTFLTSSGDLRIYKRKIIQGKKF